MPNWKRYHYRVNKKVMYYTRKIQKMDSDESGHDENEFYYPDEEDYNEIQQQNESGEDEHFSKVKK